MKTSLITLALLAGLSAACSSEQPAEQSATTEAATAAATVTDEAKGPIFIDPKGSENVAVSGYDTVSYFEGDGVPVKGSAEYKVNYNGVDYLFASADNAEKFKANPASFAPQFGGHCAWAMSRGRLAPGDATISKIVDGKLYLNFNQDVQDKWVKDIPGFIKKADKAWPAVDPKATFDNQ